MSVLLGVNLYRKHDLRLVDLHQGKAFSKAAAPGSGPGEFDPLHTAAANHDVGKLISTLMGFDRVRYPGTTGFQIPPEFDFVRNAGVEPFQMMLIPFRHKFDKQDLIDMYQGILPDIGTYLEKVMQSVTVRPGFYPGELETLTPKYETSEGEFLDLRDVTGFLSPKFLQRDVYENHPIDASQSYIFGQSLNALPDNYNVSAEFYKKLRFMVFKVKQMAEKDYDSYKRGQIAKSIVNNRLLKHPKQKLHEGQYFLLSDKYEDALTNITAAQTYGANWPYDYFSLIETIKIDIGFEVAR